MNIQCWIGKGFGYKERSSYMGVNAYIGLIQTNGPPVTSSYGPGKSKFEVDYYWQTYCSTEKCLIYEENWKIRPRGNVFF